MKNGARVKIYPKAKTFALRGRRRWKNNFVLMIVARMGEESVAAHVPADGSGQPGGRELAGYVCEVGRCAQRSVEAEVGAHELARCPYDEWCEVMARLQRQHCAAKRASMAFGL